MCGIAGIWGFEDERSVKLMMDSLFHRGPDAEGIHISQTGPGTLGHRRLSIIDPEGGNQPIFTEDGSGAIVANGEIYNFPQLLSILSTRHHFSTSSDSEAILHLYEDAGSSVVNQLDGMYAFAIAHGPNLLVARDPIGIKPLYYGEEDGTFLFASELKAFSKRSQNVREFPPGHIFHSDQGFSSFYSVPKVLPQRAPVEVYLKRIRETLENAVAKRLMSDVPLGAFLSGGLDSSIITTLARRHMDELYTFSVGIEGSRDLEAARMISQYLDTTHHEYILTPKEIMGKLPEIIYHLESFDQDLVRSAIPCFFTSRTASDHVKVILTGEGADELFGGYRYYKAISSAKHLHDELRRSVTSLHNINLQRVDRMTMAHSIEGRVPFLDLEMISLGQLIPTDLKLFGTPRVEKWILRKAFEDLLPDEVVYRCKEQFDEGSGTVDLLTTTLGGVMSDSEALVYRRSFPNENLRSSEECYYHRLFMEVFDNPEIIVENVARWSEQQGLKQD